MTEKILCVDDDSSVLQGYRRQLRKQFEIDTALGGAEGLDAIANRGPFAVIVSDMRMPEMDGIQFLAEVRRRAPDTVRVMLTGCADQRTAADAVNEGAIFRFLTKPCPPEILAKTLAAAIEQYRLITAEKHLLQHTLRGALNVLCDVLALANPAAFGQGSRVRRIVRALCAKLGVEQSWQCEIAATLSQIGCITVPPNVLEKVYHGHELSRDESRMLAGHPAVGSNLVAKIPRLEPVAEIIAYQQKRFNGSGPPAKPVAGSNIPLGARILKTALDYDTLRWSGIEDFDVMLELSERTGWYDPQVLSALENVIGLEGSFEAQDVDLKQLTTQMILAEDVITNDGTLLVTKGQEVTASLKQRLLNFAQNGRVADSVRVLARIAGLEMGCYPVRR
jgi:response regulator RpfG family c-di-GMP phosphodiesterase